jgi:hypothetical protein
MASTKITAAERLRIEALIRQAKTTSMVCTHASMPTVAQQLKELADVAQRYLEELKGE